MELIIIIIAAIIGYKIAKWIFVMLLLILGNELEKSYDKESARKAEEYNQKLWALHYASRDIHHTEIIEKAIEEKPQIEKPYTGIDPFIVLTGKKIQSRPAPKIKVIEI